VKGGDVVRVQKHAAIRRELGLAYSHTYACYAR
jgi:hypothetical protein